MKFRLVPLMLLLLANTYSSFGQYQIEGELKKWHKVTLTFEGPATSETAPENPFTDYRLEVTFTKGPKIYSVPGFYAADGNASETGATSGNKWRVHFAPDEAGEWAFKVSFRKGPNVAISDQPEAGSPVSFDGTVGNFQISPTDKIGRDNRARGRLQYVGGHHLQFAETEAYFLKVGADAPENFLAYNGFDNTPDNGGRRKSWQPHVQDWENGDPTWKNDLGKGIIGAVNYLAGEGQNAFSFLTMNIGGDDKNVFPYISDNAADRLRLDCSKLDQWEIIFEHADHKGMYLHFKTQETENDQLLDGGNLGNERKLYYRELIARFAHHLALNWNIGEENTNTDQQRKAFAQYFYDHDPYRHNVVIHTYPGQIESVYNPLVGDQSKYTGVSIQTGWGSVHKKTLDWVQKSAETGRKWVVANDEQGGAQTGVPHDGYTGSPSQDDIRSAVLYGNIMAGGAGVEYYFGYGLPHSDLSCEDFRSRDRMWDYNRYAHQFFTQYTNFWELKNHNDLIGNGNNSNGKYCLAKPGETYAIYTDGDPIELDLQTFGNEQNNNPEGAFQESDGLVIIEAESERGSGGWTEKNANGIGYYEATNNHLGNTNGGKIDYQIAIEQAGVYRFQYKTNIVDGQPATEHNDSWVKLPNNEDVHFFCFKGGLASEQAGIDAVNNGNPNLYYPSGSGRSPNFSGSNPGNSGYFKVYRSGGGSFKWNARTIDNNGFPVYVYFKKAGNYSLTLSERSAGHKVDRIALYRIDVHGQNVPTNLLDSSSESPRTGAGGNPTDGTTAFNVKWYNPRTGGDLLNGSVTSVSGPGKVSLGAPPSDPNQDWVILVTAGEISCPEAGTVCDDADPSTYDDVQDGECNCEGKACPDAGTACDDGNPNTENDQEDGNCNCFGTIPGGATDIWFEAECAEVGAQWSLMTDDQASNGAYLLPPNNAPSLDTPPDQPADIISFSAVVAQPGNYRIFARTWTTEDGDDSFWVRVNGGEWQDWNKINFGNYGNLYQWSQVGNWTSGNNVDLLTFPLLAGMNTVEFAWREAGARLDKVYLTLNGKEPQGFGGDGTANCTPCPENGTACDDGDPNTINDMEDGNCNCAGTPVVCPDAGTPCDDGDPTTTDDREDGDCNCVGTPCPENGTACDDGDPNTINDMQDGNCNCAGTPVVCPDAGTPCDDGNPATTDDREDGDCNCVGTPCPETGTACDDGDPNTINDMQDGNCNCAGTPVVCPDAGTPCDDGNPATTDDREDGDCNCVGTPCPETGTACDDGDPNTINDMQDGNCNCSGTPISNVPPIWLEAECGEFGTQWQARAATQASNREFLLPPATISTDTPNTLAEDLVTFTFEIEQAGNYLVYARTITLSENGNSFWVRMDDGEWITWNKINAGKMGSEFQWDMVGSWTVGDFAEPVEFALEAGTHTLEFSWREPNIWFDKILIAQRGIIPPDGIGDEATNCIVPTSVPVLTDPEYFDASIFPNPSNGNFTFVYSVPTGNKQGGPLMLQMIDLYGRVLRRWQLPAITDGRLNIDIGSLPSGTYYMRLLSPERAANLPLQIIR